MTEEQKILGTITGMQRMASSKNGNPRWNVEVLTQSGMSIELHTMRDAQIGYSIDNWQRHTEPVVLTLNGHNQIIDVTEPWAWTVIVSTIRFGKYEENPLAWVYGTTLEQADRQAEACGYKSMTGYKFERIEPR